jgi:hypothetical protein
MTEPAGRITSDSRSRHDGTAARWLLWMSAAVIIGLGHLMVTVGAGIARASDPLWRLPVGDMSMFVLGGEAFLREPGWHFPIASTWRLLSSGAPVSIVYTDSAPWVAIAMKSLGLHVGDVSVIGVVAVLSVVLQPVAVALLLLALGVRRAESLLFGVLLGSFLPAWYQRLVWHVALSSHWLVVLALALAALAIRRGVSWRVIVGLAALGAFSIGVHAYLFVMVAAVAAGALLSDVARVGRPAVPRAAAGLALFLAASGLSAWALGYRGGGGVGGFGRFSMNALSPVVPQISGLTQLLIGTPRWFLDATGRQYEGFNYLGGGILLCVGAAAIILWRGRSTWSVGRAVLPLVAALAGLTLFALSHKVYVRHTLVLSVPLPARVLTLFNELRSSGRMFWPVAYALLAGAVLVLDRLPRRAVSATVLTAALLLQVVDTSVLRSRLRDAYRADPSRRPTFDARAFQPGGALAGRSLRVVPSFLCLVYDHETARQAALAVERGGGVVEGGPVARFDPALCQRSEIESALLEQHAQDRLDLLFTRSVPPDLLERVRQAATCTAEEGAYLCDYALKASTLLRTPL